MPGDTERTPSCHQCRYWAPNLREEVAREGVCRKLVENPNYYGSLVTEASDNCEDWAHLGAYQDDTGEAKEDRRVALRSRINLPARLQTASFNRSAWLADISEYGAGISIHNPPAVGMPALLKWSIYEVFGSVAWSNNDSCGLKFDAPISGEIVLEAIREGALKNDRSAETSRIVPGRKRASLIKRATYSE
ncbi:hypothetical protein GRI89_11320 [Altererythrobacter salegens]|uniref:PilZ domain-containing protein n=1 Tax=Croceibacterium salegens TaxID=1737568 RepID=A0A6I4SXF9_9SPHN|nr:PilZ domain-containing protein [Croceibacterium salegens]MXO60128.1 hypothetical protein [Croceibacterium salegens]